MERDFSFPWWQKGQEKIPSRCSTQMTLSRWLEAGLFFPFPYLKDWNVDWLAQLGQTQKEG